MKRVKLPKRSRLDVILDHLHMSYASDPNLYGMFLDFIKALTFDRVDPLFSPIFTHNAQGRVLRVVFPSTRMLLTRNPEKQEYLNSVYVSGLHGCYLTNVTPQVFIRAL